MAGCKMHPVHLPIYMHFFASVLKIHSVFMHLSNNLFNSCRLYVLVAHTAYI